MRNKVASVAAVGVLGSTLAFTPVFANAASLITGADIKNNSVTTQDIKDHTLTLKDFSSGARSGLKGATGATGATGPAGLAGPTGPQGILGVSNFIGFIGPVTGSASTFVFAGPTTTVALATGQSVLATSSSALGTTASSSTVYLSECYQPAAGGALTQFGGPNNYLAVTVDTSRKTFSYSASVSPGAGSWKVGACVRDVSAQALDSNDWTSGWAMVVNGTPTTNATSSGTKAGTGSH